MRKRRILILGIVLILLAGVVLLGPASRWAMIGWIRGESFYQGRPTSYWSKWVQKDIASALQSGPVPGSLSARTDDLLVFLGFSPSAKGLPGINLHLVLAMGQEPDPTAVPVLIELLEDQDEEVRLYAAKNLRAIGNGKVAIPALVKMLKHPDTQDRITVILTLAETGPESIAYLVEALQDDDVYIVYLAVIQLGYYGPQAKQAVPELVRLLKSDRAAAQIARGYTTLGAAVASKLKEIDPQAAAEAGIP